MSPLAWKGAGRPDGRDRRRARRQAALPLQPEASLLQQVLDTARWYGWKPYHTHDSRASEAGFPDLCLVRVGRDGVGQCIMAELKRDDKRPTAAQEAWLATLATVPGITVAVWRPRDWDTIVRILQEAPHDH